MECIDDVVVAHFVNTNVVIVIAIVATALIVSQLLLFLFSGLIKSG